jgi:peptidoglycan/xylan/chitin deacetylase (PgdA/CDA1 family)
LPRLLPPLAAAVLILGACTPASPSASGELPSVSGAASSPGSAEPSLPGAPASQSPAASVPRGGTSYTVQAGDSLSSIARSWDTTVALLQAWNVDRYPSLASDPGTLQVGWVLIVSGDPNATPLPTPVATPAPTPPASGCRVGNRVPVGSQQTFVSIPAAGHAVALTFDMGGRLDPGVDILNLLIANHVCATIFPTGVMAATAQGLAVMAIIKAHPELFEIGNHTMHHCDLVLGGQGSPSTAPCATGATPSADFIRAELTNAAAILKGYAGQDPIPYWRPPYGSVNDFVRSAAASVGYTKTFMWSVDTIDWKPISDGGPTASHISAKVVGQATDGGIVLMHLGGYETLDALRTMIPGLRDRGFLLTSLSDLLN